MSRSTGSFSHGCLEQSVAPNSTLSALAIWDQDAQTHAGNAYPRVHCSPETVRRTPLSAAELVAPGGRERAEGWVAEPRTLVEPPGGGPWWLQAHIVPRLSITQPLGHRLVWGQ